MKRAAPSRIRGCRFRREHAALTRAVADRVRFGGLVGQSPVMKQLFDLLERVAADVLPGLRAS